MKKAKINNPLTTWEKKFNKGISKYRYVIERTFGSCKKWFKGRPISLILNHHKEIKLSDYKKLK